ncbi:MAG: histidinol-phosphate transaminase [Clostridiales bacterium]|nr:histidinol-phosphate transaminase [Clostridiales bacterium]
MKAWKDNIRKIDPYVAGEQPDFPDMIKLNTNENPYPPAPKVEQAMKMQQAERFRLYPDTNATPLVKALAEFYHMEEDQFFIGVGSDDVLAMSFLTFFNSEKPILFPDITYSFYDVWATLYRIPYRQPKVDENFYIRKEDYMVPNGGIVLANPNAPTSIGMDASDIEEIIQRNQDVIVIVDEAYIDFGGQSVMPLVNKYDNLVVVQTFSKSRSMAGMRIGFAVANPELIQALKDVKNSYNSYTMNRPSILLGVESVKDVDYFYSTTNKIITTRERVKEELRKLGFIVPDSQTNFLFITHPKLDMNDFFNSLREHHIYVRHWNKPRISEYLRVTIGSDQEMDTFLSFANKYCKL